MAKRTIAKMMAMFIAVIISCAFASNTDTLGVSVTILSGGAAPVINSVQILNSANGTSFYHGNQLFGVVNVSDSDNDSINLTCKFFLNGVVNTTCSFTNATLNQKIIIANISSGVVKHQNWTFEITATDGTSNTTSNSSTIAIANSVPSIPSLVSPAHQSTALNSTVNLTWSTSTDADSDAVNYTVCYGITNASTCVVTSSLNYSINLTSNKTYAWKVRSYDGEDYSSYSSTYQFYTGAAPTVSNIVVLPNPLVYIDNMGCSFTPTVAGLTTVDVVYWLERGDGYIPATSITTNINATSGDIITNDAMLSAASYSPGQYWKCGVNATSTFSTTTAYSAFQKIEQTSTTQTVVAGGGYSGGSPQTTTNVTQNATKLAAANYPAKVGAYGILLSTASVQEGITGNLKLGHVILLAELVVLVFLFSFTKGYMRFLKYIMIAIMVVSALVLLPVL